MNDEKTNPRAASAARPASMETLLELAAEVAQARAVAAVQPKPRGKRPLSVYQQADVRRRKAKWAKDFEAACRRVRPQMEALVAAGLSYEAIARTLDAAGSKYIGGRRWTGDTVRKVVKALGLR